MQKVDHQKNIIEIKKVSFFYDEKEPVLDRVNLNIHQGDYIGLIGPNGAGKTTLLKIMLDLLKPASGSVKLFGTDIDKFQDWQKIGYVPQKAANFDPNFPATVWEVVLMGRYKKGGLFKATSQSDRDYAADALEKTGMARYKDRLIGELSGGQQQRVFIARSLVNRPEIIFLDEPTAGTDIAAQENFYGLLLKLNREFGLTLVLVSHDIERVLKDAMHIACIDKSLVCHATPQEYLRESQSQKFFGQDVKIITHHHNDR